MYMCVYVREKGEAKDAMLLLSPAAHFQLLTERRGLRTTNTVHYSSQSFSVVFENTLLKLDTPPTLFLT